MLENYLLLEPNVSCEYIIKGNLFSNLIKNCHNPKLHEILLNLLDPYLSKFTIFGETQVKLWEWCYENNFFYRLISLTQNDKIEKILEEESGTTEEILQNSKKYYSGEKNELIKKEIVKKFVIFKALIEDKPADYVETMEPLSALHNETLDKVLGKLKVQSDIEYLNIEELKGKKPDIDGFNRYIVDVNKEKEKANKPIVIPKGKGISAIIIEKNNLANILDKSQLNTSEISKISNAAKKNNISIQSQEESILNKSTIDVQMGFLVSKVKGIYPNRLCKEVITPLDKVSQKDEYKLAYVREEEKIALPAASMCFYLLKSMIENEEGQDVREWLKKKKCVGGLSVVDMFFNNSAVCMEKLFLV